VTSYKQRN